MAEIKRVPHDKGAEVIRQRALEEKTRIEEINNRDLDVLGKLLGLRDHPSIAYINLHSPSTSQHHYVARLREEMTLEEIREVFANQGLTLGMYNDGRPFFNFPTSDTDPYTAYYLYVRQPLD